MNNRERTKAVLHYEKYDHMPCVHFGYWNELLEKWANEGHITKEECDSWHDNSDSDRSIAKKLGFDFNWTCSVGTNCGLMPSFENKVIEEKSDGSKIIQNHTGLIELHKPNNVSIPATLGTLLKDRQAWEELYLPKLQPSADRYNLNDLANIAKEQDKITDRPFGLHLGSLYGSIRDMLGVEELAYLFADDPDLYVELINVVANVAFTNLEAVLKAGVRPDFAHYWEDICFKNGPLVNPKVFEEFVAPHYKKMTDLLLQYGCDIVSLDCDGLIDKLIPIWLENGVNTMFPIEVGTWEASIEPWRAQYGKKLKGVGGMDKRVFAGDYSTIDAEIERLKPLVELGGYIPCPDHRIPLEAKWENVQYYCEKFKSQF